MIRLAIAIDIRRVGHSRSSAFRSCLMSDRGPGGFSFSGNLDTAPGGPPFHPVPHEFSPMASEDHRC
jgi:hypothetical protein